jgi:hypothetical protein
MKRKSITEPLKNVGTTIEDVLKELAQQGFVSEARRFGIMQVKCTGEGNKVKHSFFVLREFMRINQLYRPGGEEVADIGVLRDAMQRVCKGLPLSL